jgi:hypothetical protein
MAATKTQLKLVNDLTRMAVRVFEAARDEPAVKMTILTYVNACVLYTILDGENPTQLMNELQQRVEEVYADLDAMEVDDE